MVLCCVVRKLYPVGSARFNSRCPLAPRAPLQYTGVTGSDIQECVFMSRFVTCGVVLLVLGGLGEIPVMAAAPSFNKDVRPILAEHCFACHGQDEAARKAGLRLDTAAGATAVLKSGRAAIVPGAPSASSIMSRVLSQDADHDSTAKIVEVKRDEEDRKHCIGTLPDHRRPSPEPPEGSRPRCDSDAFACQGVVSRTPNPSKGRGRIAPPPCVRPRAARRYLRAPTPWARPRVLHTTPTAPGAE